MSDAATSQNEQDTLRSIERACRVLSESGRTLARATDETQFLQGMCRIAVELAGYSMAWVGFARHDEARNIEAVASAGDHVGYLSKARISWADDECGRGLSGKAVRSGRPQVTQNLHTASDFAPWRALALGAGHQAAATLPLVLEGKTIGVFAVFAAEADAFGAAEMALLDRVARDLAFGIQTLRSRAAQKQAEDELRAGQRVLQATFDQAPAGIAHIDLSARIMFANKKLETILGYGQGGLVGLRPRNLSHAEDVDATELEWKQLVSGEIQFFTKSKRYLRKDGVIVWVGLSVSLVRVDDGMVPFAIAIFEDITERKRHEAQLEEMNAGLETRVALRTAELETANKELEAFSYSVAHDLRAPLRAINSFSAIVIEENADKLDVTALSYLRRVREGALRMGELVDGLLDLARVSRQKVRRKDLNLGQVAGKVIAALTEAHPQRKVAVELDAQMTANCDEALIEIVLANLIGNAWKFSARVAEAHIRVGVQLCDGERVFFVRDNGAGFSMEYVKNLFEPFRRMHRREDFEGSGIGLSLVRRIIDKHGGRVWADSEEGRGANFYFTLG